MNRKSTKPQVYRTVGLFAGIGGIELGLSRAGHALLNFCEIDTAARSVLSANFPGTEIVRDIEDYSVLPAKTSLITAGFPCQDLSQAGRTLGLNDGASRSGLVGEVIRLLMSSDPTWVLLENVPFLLHIGRGQSLEILLDSLENLGFKWAYRIINSESFGLPQRRERVYILASRYNDPRNVLLCDDAGAPPPTVWTEDLAVGFYWTEGRGGLGWAVDGVPTIKSGSSIGIPSPPAILLPSGDVITPSIRDAEKLQGFPPDWTLPAEAEHSARTRWRLVGNAVSVNVAEWIGHRLALPGKYSGPLDTRLPNSAKWPKAAYNVGEGRFVTSVSAWPLKKPRLHLHEFLALNEATLLSLRATTGFIRRYEAGSLRKSTRLLTALRKHKERMMEIGSASAIAEATII